MADGQPDGEQSAVAAKPMTQEEYQTQLEALNARAKAAGLSPTKVDDFLVHLMGPAIEDALALIDAGDTDGVKKKLAGLRALVPK